VKLKKNATRPNVEYLVNILNSSYSFLGGDKDLFVSLFEHAKSQNVFFSEKELFILSNQVHIYNALFALEVYSLSERLPLLDTILGLTLESLGIAADMLTDYALTLGKTTQGVNVFKNNMQALTDKSKMIGTGKGIPEGLRLSRVYQLHAAIHERVLSLLSVLTNEMNNDYGSLFAEKKYKELLSFAKEQQEE
jgi:hypothetical protein